MSKVRIGIGLRRAIEGAILEAKLTSKERKVVKEIEKIVFNDKLTSEQMTDKLEALMGRKPIIPDLVRGAIQLRQYGYNLNGVMILMMEDPNFANSLTKLRNGVEDGTFSLD